MEHVDNPSYLQTIWAPIASVGWYIVGLGIIALYTFPHIQEKFKSWKVARNQRDAALGKKTDELPQLSSNVELARQKLQEAYDRSCILAQIKEEEEKEKKRQKVWKLKNKNIGTRLGSTDDETPSTSTNTKYEYSTKSKLKSEYNPLMGDSTRGYRPPKRSCCKKGGCG